MRQIELPYDLSALPIHALLINNTYNENAYLPQLQERVQYNDLMAKALSQRFTSVTRYENLSAKEMKEKTAAFITNVKDHHDQAVTLLYFSGYGTRSDYDPEDTFLCGTDYNNRYRELPFRLNGDYFHPLSEIKGIHMLVLDVCDIPKGGEYQFAMPELPPGFHVLYPIHNICIGKGTITTLTQCWCENVQQGRSIEEVAKKIRLSI